MNKKIIFLSLLFCMKLTVNAQQYIKLSDQEISTVKQKLKEVALKTKTIKSSFIQTKNLTILSEKIRSRGRFYFKKDNLIRWEYITPYKYVIIFNNNTINIDNEGKKNTIDIKSNKIFKDINSMILSSIRGDIINQSALYDLQFLRNRSYVIIRLTPHSKEIKKYMNYIEVFFNTKNYQVARVNIVELSGDYTNIVFTHKKNNQKISDEMFNIN